MNNYFPGDRFTPRGSLALLMQEFADTELYSSQFRLVLESLHRAHFSRVELVSPSLEIGVRDGLSSSFVHHGKGKFDWGGDMPLFNTHESLGLDVPRRFMNYHALIGMDGTNIPFADGSLQTVVASQVIDYGMDKRQMMAEMLRVLRPGGTLAFTMATPLVNEYPRIREAWQRWVPGLEGVRPINWWSEQLSQLGATNVEVRPIMGERLGAVLLADVFTSMLFAPINAGHIRNLDQMKSIYEESWCFFQEQMEAELAQSPVRSWFAVATARKANGPISDPTPVCPKCRSANLQHCELSHSCRDCQSTYAVNFGVPIYVRDSSQVYSPPSGTTLLYKKVLRPYREDKILRYLRKKAKRFRGQNVFVIGSGEIARRATEIVQEASPAQLTQVDSPTSISTLSGAQPACFVLATRPVEALLWTLGDRKLLTGILTGRTWFLPNGLHSTIVAAFRELFLLFKIARLLGLRLSFLRLFSGRILKA
jgi:SAM-dependent methyltransferase